MASPNQSDFLDLVGRRVATENVVICDNFDIYDVTQIHFSPFRDMLYRGRLSAPKELFGRLPRQLQAIFHKRNTPPKQKGDFSTYRSNDQSSSSSSSNSAAVPQHQPHGNDAESAIADGSEATGLLSVPLNIDGTVPLSQAYKQYEPRGFKLIADTSPIEGQIHFLTRYPTIAASLSKKRKQVGFSREEVVMYGGLACTPCRPSNLPDPLRTTLFKQDNFYNVTQDVYNTIMPALKLAEKFITDPMHIGYWSTLAFGTRTVDLKLTAATNLCHERLVTSVPVTDEVYRQTLHLLNRLGNLVEYRFEIDEEFASMTCFGKTPKLERKWNLAPQYYDTLSKGHLWPSGEPFPMPRPYAKDPWDDGQVIRLHLDFYTAAKRFSATKNQDLAARLRFNFWFAVCIVHELAHVFERKSSQSNFDRMASTCTSFEEFKQIADPRFAFGTFEAYWGNAAWAEAGGRWEWETFGARVQPINGKTDASRGMFLFNGDGYANISVATRADVPIGTCIQMAFMEEVQQQSFWMRSQRTLKFPVTGARAYVSTDMSIGEIDEHLRQQNEEHAALADPVTDPSDMSLEKLLAGAIAQGDAKDVDDRPSKRRRTDNTFSATKTRAIKKLPKRGRLRQPLIRRYTRKADADAKVMREAAMAQFACDEVQRNREAATERETAEERRKYRSPSPGQSGLHVFFSYPDEDPDEYAVQAGHVEAPYVDPATKKPEDLTLDDKWKVAEEFVCLAMNWEPVEFQSQRSNHPTWRPASPFNPDNPNDFTQDDLNILITTRADQPGNSWPERRAAEKAQYEQKKFVAHRMAEMDELITYMGFSRIESYRLFTRTGQFPMGMSVVNFPAYKPMLDAFRLVQKLQRTREYVSAVAGGQVGADATNIGLLHADGKPAPQPVAAEPGLTPRITNYFRTSRPADLRASSASTESPSSDLAGFSPLTKVATPEELVQKHAAWVAAGADMRSRPKGVHPAQLLSASLGGSLQAVLPSQLRAVVLDATRRWEAGEAERKRKEARERADAAEERKRKRKRSGDERRVNGSSSTEAEL